MEKPKIDIKTLEDLKAIKEKQVKEQTIIKK